MCVERKPKSMMQTTRAAVNIVSRSVWDAEKRRRNVPVVEAPTAEIQPIDEAQGETAQIPVHEPFDAGRD
ncbi:hypothetical protein A3A40_01315 [Candidatus Kaiserbacteria bacterium RIFCSPLOWO2_01_FULL_54_20]|uniref:Uncharacterized protein n=1 Tax=Candidatus Kaiserbacteria bacterium RIFCSPLOWO2_01_FULL_54_20 TaxID=1798513 RepID=A0A1F6EK59_9BACT|nr:MAG: hypothetical protein A3A40_01315 [Candidatus Kaiserbacteria bacterium RIFCSPLOWO2_01_FULL_54_20]